MPITKVTKTRIHFKADHPLLRGVEGRFRLEKGRALERLENALNALRPGNKLLAICLRLADNGPLCDTQDRTRHAPSNTPLLQHARVHTVEKVASDLDAWLANVMRWTLAAQSKQATDDERRRYMERTGLDQIPPDEEDAINSRVIQKFKDMGAVPPDLTDWAQFVPYTR